MKIKTNMLSKEALVEIVDVVREVKTVPDSLILAFYKRDLALQLKNITHQLEKIQKVPKEKLTRKQYAAVCTKENRLVALGNKKLKLCKELENATIKS